MSGETFDEFNALVLQEDETEAWEINHQYDELASEEFSGDLLDHAIKRAHERLAESRYGAEAFGYQVVRDARLWWNYRNAYFNEKVVPELPADEVDDMAEFHGMEQEDINYQLEELKNPLYYLFYSQLEAYRAKHVRHGEIVDPFTLEKDYALTILMNVMDEMLDQPSAMEDSDQSKTAKVVLATENEVTDFVLRREYHQLNGGSMYYLDGFLPVSGANNGGGHQTFIKCRIAETPGSIMARCVYMLNGQVLSGLQIIDLAEELSPSKQFSLHRTSSPVPELAGRAGRG